MSAHKESPRPSNHAKTYRVKSDVPFLVFFSILAGSYVALIVMMLVAEATYTTPGHLLESLNDPYVRYSTKLSMTSCTITTILSLWVAIPVGYLMSRFPFPGKYLIDAILDIPIVLPPLVIGLCLLILFQLQIGKETLDGWCEVISKAVLGKSISITYEKPSVILAQFMVACAFAVRTMRLTFDQIHPRCEQVAMTLGCNRGQAFWRVVFPEARHGLLSAATLSWARSLGEFGPILIFAGATRMKTEVLPTTVFLELTVGNIEGAVAASMIMVAVAVIVLVVARWFGIRRALF